MMDEEDLDNELSSDDEDYNPEGPVDSVSENSAGDDDDPENSDNENATTKPKKRKKGSNRRKAKPVEEVIEEKEEPTMSKEEMKRRADELWADFLGDSDTPPKPNEIKNCPATSSSTSTASPKPSKPIIPEPAKVFEFAGETVEIPVKTVEQPKLATAVVKPPIPGVKRPSGGLSSMLNQLTKKNKLSVLEKTKIDWDGFKSSEGISEELQTHNRGRDGFLERKDFLQRTDLRQFEIEKNLRLTKRK